jgi:septum site-determining protein MinC
MDMDERPVKVQIKGVRDGLLISLGEGEWAVLEEALMMHIQDNAGFFQGARVALELGNLVLHAAEIGQLRDKLSERGITLWAILSNSGVTENAAQMLGLATRITTPKTEKAVRMTADTNLSGQNAILVQRTLRSGFRVAYQGHVVVLGDINPGAEVIAAGSVVVWGRLRGVVHAGAEGDASAMVCALDMTPTQLRIASYIAVTPQRKGKPHPEIAKIIEGQVVAEPWDYKKEGGR